jgi:hypothetical protein
MHHFFKAPPEQAISLEISHLSLLQFTRKRDLAQGFHGLSSSTFSKTHATSKPAFGANSVQLATTMSEPGVGTLRL